MDPQKRQRSENWSSEEKELLCQIIGDVRDIIENKSNKLNINNEKNKEWRNITNKFNELTGKNRSSTQIKLMWKRMKLRAKANMSAHRVEQFLTGGGEKPPSPSQEDLQIISIAPSDFIVEYNDYDSDAVKTVTDNIPMAIEETDVIMITPDTSNKKRDEIKIAEEKDLPKQVAPVNHQKKTNKKSSKDFANARDLIIESNTTYKKRHLEILEEERRYVPSFAKHM